MNSVNEKRPFEQEDSNIHWAGTNERLMTIFHKAATASVWYKKLLLAKACDASMIETADDFFNIVPVLSKEAVFCNIALSELLQSPLSSIHSFMLSSGQAGSFSVGIITNKEYQDLALRTDFFLEDVFGIKKGEAIVINASSMGVRIFTSHTCCDTGPRPDIVIEMLRTISPLYDKTVVVADPYMVKQIAEGAVEAGIAFERLKIWFISGGDWLPETLRKYVHRITGKSASEPDKGYWSAIYGVTELGYPLFFETPDLAVLRSEILTNGSLIESAYKMGRCTTPFLFSYSTDQLFVEQINNSENVPELAFTVLDENRTIPMIRYKTGDIGEVRMPDTFKATDSSLGRVLFWGRNLNYLSVGNNQIFINDIREMLFDSADLAKNSTGFFTLTECNGKGILKVQLIKGKYVTRDIEKIFEKKINFFYPGLLTISFESYHSFTSQMELDTERKFNHLKNEYNG